MKRTVVLAALGLGLIAANSAYSQGHIEVGNYQGAYNQVVWGGGTPRDGLGVLAAEGVVLTLWYGEGAGLTADALQPGVVLPWKFDTEHLGEDYWGFYFFTEQVLPNWSPGESYTFQIRASGDSIFGPVDEAASRSILWTEMAQINAITDPPTPASRSGESIGFTVFIPEPSSFALLGLGSAAMLIFRRRR